MFLEHFTTTWMHSLFLLIVLSSSVKLYEAMCLVCHVGYCIPVPRKMPSAFQVLSQYLLNKWPMFSLYPQILFIVYWACHGDSIYTFTCRNYSARGPYFENEPWCSLSRGFTPSVWAILKCRSRLIIMCLTKPRTSLGIITWLLPINATGLETGVSPVTQRRNLLRPVKLSPKGLRDS